jgi:hypothetical protein
MNKIQIISLDPAENGTGAIEAQYNPKEIAIDKSVPWQKSQSSQGDQPELQFTSAEGRSMSFELFFDEYESGGNVHEMYVAELLRMAMVINTNPDAPEDQRRPTRVRVKWGGMPAFEGVIESVATKYTMFLPDGTPCRCTCAVKFKEAKRAVGPKTKKKAPPGGGGSGGGSGGGGAAP